MEPWIIRDSFKVNVKLLRLQVNFERDPQYSWIHEQTKIECIAYIYILL